MKLATGKSLVDEKAQSVRNAMEVARVARFHQKRLTATMKFMEHVLERFDEEKHGLSHFCWADANAWTSDQLNATIIHMQISAKVLSMKEGLVPQMLKVLMDAGFDATSTNDYTSEWSGYRTYKLQRLASEAQAGIIVEFVATPVKSEAATCRKVQTGVEMKEVPVWKLECEDATPAEIEAAV